MDEFEQNIHSDITTLIDSKEHSSQITKRVKRDFEIWVKSLPGSTNSAALRELSNQTGLNVKTLRNTIKGDSIPSPRSLLKIYRAFLDNCKSRSDFLNHLPEIIFEKAKENPQLSEMTFNAEVETEYFKGKIKSCSIYRWIFFEAATSNQFRPLTNEKIKFEFGKQGIIVLDEMTSTRVLKGTNVGSIIQFELDKTPDIDNDLSFWIAKYLVNEKVTLEDLRGSSDNHFSWYTNGVSREIYDKILKITSKASKDIIDLAQSGPEAEGDIKFFTSFFVDKERKSRGSF